MFITNMTLQKRQKFKVEGYNMNRHVTRIGEKSHVNRVLLRKSFRKRSLGRQRTRWEDTILTNVKDLGCENGR